MTTKYGTVEHLGRTLTLTQDPYCDGDGNRTYYRAAAVGPDGDEHNVYWTPLPGFEEIEDDSYACDWTAYTVDCK